LPDLRGQFLRGFDDGAGVDTGRVLGSAQTDAFQGHYHNSSGGTITGGGGALAGGSTLGNGPNAVTSPSSDGTNGTPRTAAETRPKNIALLACIKY